MATEVIMPALGMAQETGKLLRWLKSEGDPVARGEALMEIETDKVTVEIEAAADGTLAGIAAAEGEDVPVGRAVAYILAPGETAPAPRAGEPAAAVEASPSAGPVSAVAATDGRSGVATAAPRRVLASPKARRLAREHGVAIERLRGSGPRGAVQAADVLAFAGAPASAPETAGPPPPAWTASSAWNTMAARMQQSWRDVPHFYLERDVDATRLNSWRDAVRTREGYEKVTHTDLLVVLCARALASHPRVNASWNDGSVAASPSIDIGIAVATDEALIVPVIHDADRLELLEVSRVRSDVVERARTRKLRPADVTGGTFTISNLGMFGVDAFHAIVNAPQAAILAVGRIVDRIVPVDGKGVVRPILTLSISFDHRVVDGAEGARFLETLASLVEEPAGLVR